MIAIVTDSTAYMTREEAAIYGVRVVPISYIVDGKIFKEDFSGSDKNLKWLVEEDKTPTKTLQPGIDAFYDTFKKLIDSGFEVICITLSSRISSAFNSAKIAADKFGKGLVSVIDSQVIAGGLNILVKKARELDASGMNTEKIVNELEKLKEKLVVRFCIDDMDILKSSKRLSVLSGNATTILGQKPIMYFENGALVTRKSARNSFDRLKKLTEGITSDVPYIILHSIKKTVSLNYLIKSLKSICPLAKIEIRQAGPVVGAHIGFKMIGIAWCKQ